VYKRQELVVKFRLRRMRFQFLYSLERSEKNQRRLPM
jgi:hypothetical protein